MFYKSRTNIGVFLQMLQINKLRDVVYSNLFPTAEMVISLSREFGIPLTYEDFEKEPRPATPYCGGKNDALILLW